MAVQEPATAQIDNNPGSNPADAAAIDYQERQDARQIDPQLRSLQDFIDEDDETSPLGVVVREDQRKLNSGEVANGLLIVGVRDGSPASKGGLRAIKHTARNIASGVALAAGMFFPPALFAVAVINQPGFAEKYDLIIGIDGRRVVSYMDLEDSLRDLQPGETVYVSVVRNGARIQVPLHVGSLTIAPF